MAREGEGGRASQDQAVAVRYAERGAGAVLGKMWQSVCDVQKWNGYSARQDAAAGVWCARGEGVQSKARRGGRCVVSRRGRVLKCK